MLVSRFSGKVPTPEVKTLVILTLEIKERMMILRKEEKKMLTRSQECLQTEEKRK